MMVVLQQANKGTVERLVMRDFEGLQNCDKATREAVLNFSYNMSISNMDEAFRAIKTIQRCAIYWITLCLLNLMGKEMDVMRTGIKNLFYN